MQWKKTPLKVLYWMARRAAAGYVAGPLLSDALTVCDKLTARGWKSTICPWDAVGTLPAAVAVSYRAAIDALGEGNYDCYLSIKAPSLNYDATLLRDLAAAGAACRIRIHFDALSAETVEPTLALLEDLRRDYANLGFTLPSRWKRSMSDAARLAPLGIPVRIVKGQFAADRAAEMDPSSGFITLADALAGNAGVVGVASHDRPLAAQALSRLSASGTSCELEQLYGLPLRGAAEAAKSNIPVRVYVPYDYGYLPYALEHLRAHPRTLWWLVRDAFAARRLAA